MEILQLRYFFDSAKNESFAKTAQKYMVPTTSVSASIRRLESELGCALFDRLPNRVLLNENGKKLQQSLCVVFKELDHAVELLSVPETDTREIRMLVRAMRIKITDYIIEYKARHPHISFKTVFDFGDTNFDNYDIIIDDNPSLYSEYESFELCSMRLGFKVSAASPLCERKLSLIQLCNQPFISMGEQSSMHRILMNVCSRAGFTPDIVVQSNDIICYRKCLESGVGIGMGRDEAESYNDKIKFLNVSDFDVRQTVCGFYKTHNAYGNVEHFIKFLKSKVI